MDIVVNPLRVLIIAENANPEWISVPLVGWSHSQAISKICDVHIITQVRNRDSFIRAGLTEGKDFTAIDTEWVAKPIYKFGELIRGGKGKGWTTISAITVISYYAFEFQVWKKFKSKIKNGDYDVVHRMVPLSPTTPGWSLARGCKKSGVPFVLGPINGGVPWPKAFDAIRRAEKEWLTYLRSAYKLLPGYRSTRQCASAIIVGSIDTYGLEPSWVRDKLIYIPENAVDPIKFPTPSPKTYELPLRAAFIGRLVPYKGVDMLIEAVSDLVRSGKLILDIFGDGPEMPRLVSMIKDINLSKSIRLHGFVKHEELNKQLKSCHLFIFPSIREFGGAVVLEAMASGLVPIVVNYGGPAELVTDKTGFCIPIGTRKEIIDGFKSTIPLVIDQTENLSTFVKCGLNHVQNNFTWEAKSLQTLEVYKWVSGRIEEKPDFGMPLGS